MLQEVGFKNVSISLNFIGLNITAITSSCQLLIVVWGSLTAA